jgi:hypothetical protein
MPCPITVEREENGKYTVLFLRIKLSNPSTVAGAINIVTIVPI